MSKFEIKGGNILKGEITPQGAKNEALQVISAVLLTAEEINIKNIPNIKDVNLLLDILKDMGVEINKNDNNDYIFKAQKINLKHLETDKFKKDASSLRGSIMLMGPIIARYHNTYMPKPGGDKIGRRRLDTHFNGFKKLGAIIEIDRIKNMYHIYIDKNNKLKGSDIILEESSVTGTANIIMLAVLCEGITNIYNAACEPYIQQLCKMLNNMGANITGIGSNLIKIKGVKKLHGTNHTILPDMIEIGSWIGLAAITKSEIIIKNVSLTNLGIIPHTFRKIGINIVEKDDNILIPAQNQYEIQKFIDGSIMTISDSPWPGFTPDLLSIILVTATQAKGSILIHQKMFESRLFFVDKLIEMGAQIILCDPHRCVVIGLNHNTQLKATKLSSPDIRAGMSLLIAALSAKGTTIIENIEQIDRGYENIDKKLKNLGADIIRKN